MSDETDTVRAMNATDHDPLSARFAIGIALVLAALLVFIAARADADDAPPTQAECFLRHRRGGSARLSRARQRRWVRELDVLTRVAVDAASLEERSTVTPGLVLAVAFHESSWRPRARGRHRHEYGLMQILPEKLRAFGLRRGEDALDPAVNLRMGIEALRQCEAACAREDRGDVLRCYALGRCERSDLDGDGRRDRDRRVEIMHAWADQADECALRYVTAEETGSPAVARRAP